MKTNSPEFKKMQRDRIYETKPWLKSTGAKTVLGKEKSKMNALRTDPKIYALFKEFDRLIKQQNALPHFL